MHLPRGNLARAVIENYEAMDVEARNLLPLRKILAGLMFRIGKERADFLFQGSITIV